MTAYLHLLMVHLQIRQAHRNWNSTLHRRYSTRLLLLPLLLHRKNLIVLGFPFKQLQYPSQHFQHFNWYTILKFLSFLKAYLFLGLFQHLYLDLYFFHHCFLRQLRVESDSGCWFPQVLVWLYQYQHCVGVRRRCFHRFGAGLILLLRGYLGPKIRLEKTDLTIEQPEELVLLKEKTYQY